MWIPDPSSWCYAVPDAALARHVSSSNRVLEGAPAEKGMHERYGGLNANGAFCECLPDRAVGVRCAYRELRNAGVPQLEEEIPERDKDRSPQAASCEWLPDRAVAVRWLCLPPVTTIPWPSPIPWAARSHSVHRTNSLSGPGWMKCRTLTT